MSTFVLIAIVHLGCFAVFLHCVEKAPVMEEAEIPRSQPVSSEIDPGLLGPGAVES